MIHYVKAEARIKNHWPGIGKLIRRRTCARLAADGSADFVPLLVEALDDPDEQVRATAAGALRNLNHRDAVDALCAIAIREPAGPAAKICLETGKRPSDPEQACLFLFVTRQLDEYFQEDFEFQNLRAAYDRADPRVREHVMEVARSGDRRCQGFFGGRKPLAECSDSEIQVALDSALRHRDWPRLFRAFLELPPKFAFPLLEHFHGSGWAPAEPEADSLYQSVLADSSGQTVPPWPHPDKTSPVFERWLARGRSEEFARAGEPELVRRLESAPPPEGVAIVAALAGRHADASAIRNNPHWLVRLAGYATGLLTDFASDSPIDDNYWVRELTGAEGLLGFWPGKATPADLERLSQAPREAFTGKLGAVRKVLRTVLAHRISTGTFEEMAIEAGEFAGEFEEAQ
jgi:hypothetical protein